MYLDRIHPNYYKIRNKKQLKKYIPENKERFSANLLDSWKKNKYYLYLINTRDDSKIYHKADNEDVNFKVYNPKMVYIYDIEDYSYTDIINIHNELLSND